VHTRTYQQLVATAGCDFKCRVFSAYIPEVKGGNASTRSMLGDLSQTAFGDLLAEFDASNGWVESVAWSPSGKYFLVATGYHHSRRPHTIIYTYIYTYVHSYMHTCIHAYIHTYIHIHRLHTYVHTYIHRCTGCLVFWIDVNMDRVWRLVACANANHCSCIDSDHL
jgi:hypothetical protein